MEDEVKPKINIGTLVIAIYRIYANKVCPRCRYITPYYNDCPVCEGLNIGCDRLKKEDCLIKYISWLKRE